ncbi:Cilia- and flagella-associated protein 20 [Armadillidium nasatum]|uniref:Cilia-and flagella-associated protein 20 n=1 Tax=Armadillidium nasatum TaxID=96803 RepID=A0A5N5SX90_9CRUS|nr:Cilia- and flagella-associated protein 20 [Armadillidium nasatum]
MKLDIPTIFCQAFRVRCSNKVLLVLETPFLKAPKFFPKLINSITEVKYIKNNNIYSIFTTYITCPSDPKKTLGIKLPYLVMIVKNLNKYFTFEVQVLDDKNVRRRFRASNYQSTTRVKPFICTMPMRLDEGWNQIVFNLADFVRRAYGTNYVETLRVQIHANCRIRRVYFADRLYSEEELPAEFKLYLPFYVYYINYRIYN